MIITSEQATKYCGGGGTQFFKIEDNEQVRVRFLYDTLNDIQRYEVHLLTENRRFISVDCNRMEEEPKENCKWCSQDIKRACRVVIPIFNVNTQQISYWERSISWVNKQLIPCLEQIPSTQPIAGQIFLLKKVKTGPRALDVVYSIQPEINTQNDGTSKTSFGKVLDGMECGIIKPYDYELPVTNVPQQTYGQQTYGQPTYGQQTINTYGTTQTSYPNNNYSTPQGF